MALEQARQTQTVQLGGWTTPYDYEAGEYAGRSYPAGVSMKVFVLSGEHDVTMLKCKTNEVRGVLQAIRDIETGSLVEIEFTQNGADYRLYSIALVERASVAA